MPIKTENALRYPRNWKREIRPEVLERDGHKCKRCGVANYSYRNNVTGQVTESAALAQDWALQDNYQVTRIVLTVAHLNHVVEDVGEPGNRPNLAALCQKCHLANDQEHHLRNSWKTRREKKRTPEMF